jgi:hypothetical protein
LIPNWPCSCFLPIIFPLSEVAKEVFNFRPSLFYANAGASQCCQVAEILAKKLKRGCRKS